LAAEVPGGDGDVVLFDGFALEGEGWGCGGCEFAALEKENGCEFIEGVICDL
jgi:hypothetical protein